MDPALVTTALGALAVVLGLVVLAARLLRRFGLAPATAPAGSRRMQVAERLPIDARRQLLLLQCDGQRLLLLSGGPQDVLLPLPEKAP